MSTETQKDPALIVAEGYYRLKAENEKLREQRDRYAEVLHDGYAVYAALTDDAKQYTTPENVSAVLDAFKSALANNSDEQ